MSRIFILISSDGIRFTVNETVAFLSPTIKNLCNEQSDDSVEVQIPNVIGRYLAAFTAYCELHVAAISEGIKFTPMEITISSTDLSEDFLKAIAYLKLDTFANVRFFQYHEGTMGLLFTDSTMSRKIILKSSDGMLFDIDEAVALQCQTLKNMIEDDCVGSAIPIWNVNGRTLQQIIRYCEIHAGAFATTGEKSKNDYCQFSSEKELKAWDANFLKVRQDFLFDLLKAANYLDIGKLVDLICQTIADMMRGKTPAEIRTLFHIENDYTPEEEAAVRRENEWAFADFHENLD